MRNVNNNEWSTLKNKTVWAVIRHKLTRILHIVKGEVIDRPTGQFYILFKAYGNGETYRVDNRDILIDDIWEADNPPREEKKEDE